VFTAGAAMGQRLLQQFLMGKSVAQLPLEPVNYDGVHALPIS